uniref:hypothetical protein n=1 Tax=Roseovarius indicus TaxID=540747 RepID=UPI003B52E4A5
MPVRLGRHIAGLAHCLACLALLTILAAPAEAQGYDIFAPPPPQAASDYEAALRSAGVLTQGQTAGDLSVDQQAALGALRLAQEKPSMGSAIALLSHFPTFADKKNDLFRRTLAQEARNAFLMADAAKYELVLRTNKRIHSEAASSGGIAVSLRVGSTGLRFAQWQQWVAAGRPMDGEWTFRDPFDDGRTTTFTGMPVDQTYIDAKLLNADDDVTNWASEAARKADPLANERLNGKAAATIFAEITADELRRLDPDERKAVRGGAGSVAPDVMMVEFLSPTQAYNIMGDEAKRNAKGWEAPIDLTRLHFLGAWVHADPEKYNGLYAEEQLHAWGMKKGYVTENVAEPLADGSTKTYRESATEGVLKDITGADVFPKGVKDPFGWMATNYRQIFVTHDGDLDSLAKYSERMIDWWSSVNLSPEELRNLAANSPGIRPISAAEFDTLEALARDIRNAESADAKGEAIEAAGGKDQAIAKLKDLNQAMMITGQRKHLEQLAESATKILQQDSAARTLKARLEAPLDFAEILAEAERRRGANAGEDDPYVAFETSINAYANGYANLPADVAQNMAADIAAFVESDFLKPQGEGQISAELRLQLLPVLERGAERARAVGTDIREDADGLARFATLANSDLGERISKHLVDLGEPDLHGYLNKILQGEVTRRKYWLLPESEGGWPKVQEVDQIWRPADIGNDFKRIMWLGQKLGWSDAQFGERLAAYFNGPEYRVPTAPLPDGEAPRQSYSDKAIDAYLAFSRLFERAASTTHYVTMTDSDGNIVTKQINGTSLLDGTISTGQVLWMETVRGAEFATKVWGIKGDVEAMASFASTLHSFTLGSPDQTDADRARALATMASDAYGLLPKLAEQFPDNRWAQTIDDALGSNSRLGKFGGTAGAALKGAGSAFQTPESQEALYGAVVTDLLAVWQPHVATAMTLHAMYKWGATKYATSMATSEMVQLLARNGEWEFPEDGTPPKLTALHLGELVIPEDAEARKRQCVLRGQSAMARDSRAKTTSVGVEEAIRIIPAFQEQGVPLCKRINGKVCEPAAETTYVKPREAALTLFKTSGLEQTDPLLLANRDAINAMTGWVYFDGLRRFFFDDGSEWTAARLESHGIYPPTPEDASFVLREPIEVRMKPSDFADRPRDSDNMWIHAGVWRSLHEGGRKMLGYMASDYWVRRQYLMECVLMDEWIRQAALQAQKNDYEGIDIGDVAGRLASLDRRMRALDAKVWPVFAASYQPYPKELEGAPYPDDQKLAIYDHYLGATANPRRDLRDLIAWFEGEQTPDNVPDDILGRAVARQMFALDPGSAPSSGRAALMGEEGDETEFLRKSQTLLQTRVETMLADITDMVGKYEDGFDKVLKRVAKFEKFVARAEGYRIAPVHVAIMGVGGFDPPGGRYGKVEDHLFPDGAWTEDMYSGSAENELLSSLNVGDLSFAADGSVGAALREWETSYEQALDDARDGVGERIAPMQTTLLDDKQWMTSRITPIYSDETARFEVMVGMSTDELAAAHPLFPRILRQAFQANKVQRVAAQAARVGEVELAAVGKELKADGPEGKAPEIASVDDLKAAGDGFILSAGELIALTGDLFEIDVAGDGLSAHFVGNTVERSFAAKPRTGEGMPVVTPDDLKAWIDRVYWEVARNHDFSGPVQRIGVDPERDIAFPPALLPEEAGAAHVPPLMTCDASRTDGDYEARVVVLPGDEDHALHLPLVSPGVFYLRAVAVSRHDVPLARADLKFEVAPAELRGALEVTGGEIDTAQGEKVELHVGGRPWRKLVSETADLPAQADRHPILTLHGAGLFRAQLCGTLSQIMLNTEPVPPKLNLPSEAARNLETAGFFFPSPHAATAELIESDTVTSVAMEPGVFGLKAPVEIVLPRAEAVPVSLIAKDASGAEVTPEESRVHVGDESHAGPWPVSLDLEDGDALTGTAEMTVVGGTARGTTEPVAFSVADHVGGLELEVEIPAYARGNLDVTGRFVVPEDMDGFGGIAGGQIWSNLLPDSGAVLRRAGFGFANAEAVALANGLSMEALLYADDEVETYLTAAIPGRAALPEGGRLDLGDLSVEVLRAKTFQLTVTLEDWTGRTLLDPGAARVTLDGSAFEEVNGRFTIRTSFRGRKQERALLVSYATPDGDLTETVKIGADIVDDPLNPTDPDPIVIRLPFYQPGSLRLSGTSAFDDARFADEAPRGQFGTGFRAKPVMDDWEEIVGRPFLFDLSFPVPVGAPLMVSGKTRIGMNSFKGSVSAAAPDTAGAGTVTLDMGVLKFEPFLDLIPMPDLVDMTVDEVEQAYGETFTFQVSRPKVAERDEDIGRIYVQAPLPDDSPDRPSLVPRGMLVSLAAYEDPAEGLVVLPPVTGMDEPAARAILKGLDERIVVTTVPGRPAEEGEEPDRVLEQSPGGGTPIDPATQGVTLTVTTFVTASVAPEEGEEDEGEVREPVEPDGGENDGGDEEETGDPGAFAVAGEWVGTFRVTHVELDVSVEEGSRIAITCREARPCAHRWVAIMAEELEKEIERQEAEAAAREDDSGLGSLGEAVTVGALDGFGLAIIGVAAFGGVAVIDMMFEGIDYGMIVRQSEEGEISLQLPDDESGLSAFLALADASVGEDGGLVLSMEDRRMDQALVTLRGRISPTSAGARMEVTLSARGTGQEGDATITMVGDMVRGVPDMTPILPRLQAQLVGALENPPAHYRGLLAPLKAKIDEMTESSD